MSGGTVLLFPLFGFFLVCALLAWWEARHSDRADTPADGPLPPALENSALAAYAEQQSDPVRIVRSARRRATFFGLLAAATLTYILVRS